MIPNILKFCQVINESDFISLIILGYWLDQQQSSADD